MASTETIKIPSAVAESQPSTSKDAPLEALDSWILRWTTLELSEHILPSD
jgi:hypothetical protein